jgi:hypothetical protein
MRVPVPPCFSSAFDIFAILMGVGYHHGFILHFPSNIENLLA